MDLQECGRSGLCPSRPLSGLPFRSGAAHAPGDGAAHGGPQNGSYCSDPVEERRTFRRPTTETTSSLSSGEGPFLLVLRPGGGSWFSGDSGSRVSILRVIRPRFSFCSCV